MVIELVRSSDKSPKVNQDLVAMLREVLAMAEAGNIQAAAVAYVQDGTPSICYEADGFEAEVACAARQVDEEMRSVLFFDADTA
ncbi:hypothetical protein AAG565_05535 [Fontimonas sp. SYSU GA230001]|uniref:hypothetical protein n=1 Tax=Fontimonas sp. SYSU GA230001 TaxID=3142450 RepID=UPI0032B3A623